MLLTQFKALTFDCYGTLIDWESGMTEGLKPLTDKIGREMSRNEILEAPEGESAGSDAHEDVP